MSITDIFIAFFIVVVVALAVGGTFGHRLGYAQGKLDGLMEAAGGNAARERE